MLREAHPTCALQHEADQVRCGGRCPVVMLFFLEQCLNGLQLGLLLFLLAAGLTLVFGIMDMVNLAHGSLYMIGAYFAATFVAWTGSFVAGGGPAPRATLLVGGGPGGGAIRPPLGTGAPHPRADPVLQ